MFRESSVIIALAVPYTELTVFVQTVSPDGVILIILNLPLRLLLFVVHNKST